MNEFNFKIIKPYKQSRLGKLSTAHGEIDTPVFMPVGTAATVKALKVEDIKASNSQIILAGFSQGCMMSINLGLTSNEKFKLSHILPTKLILLSK